MLRWTAKVGVECMTNMTDGGLEVSDALTPAHGLGRLIFDATPDIFGEVLQTPVGETYQGLAV